jgi:hypothetical protein
MIALAHMPAINGAVAWGEFARYTIMLCQNGPFTPDQFRTTLRSVVGIGGSRDTVSVGAWGSCGTSATRDTKLKRTLANLAALLDAVDKESVVRLCQ